MAKAAQHKLISIEFRPLSEAVLFDRLDEREAAGEIVLGTYSRQKREWTYQSITPRLSSQLSLIVLSRSWRRNYVN